MNQRIIVYTDGGSRGNPGIGGWGVFVQHTDGTTTELMGAQEQTTNNRMELTAAIKALQHLPEQSHIDLHTDSTYLKDGITKWIMTWKKNDWKTAAKKSVKNKDLWQRLDALVTKHDIAWHWVKGHDGNDGNEQADALCNRAMDTML